MSRRRSPASTGIAKRRHGLIATNFSGAGHKKARPPTRGQAGGLALPDQIKGRGNSGDGSPLSSCPHLNVGTLSSPVEQGR
jgi:hypothetical protein